MIDHHIVIPFGRQPVVTIKAAPFAFSSKAAKLGGRVVVLPVDMKHGEINKKLGLLSDYTTTVEAFITDKPYRKCRAINSYRTADDSLRERRCTSSPSGFPITRVTPEIDFSQQKNAVSSVCE